MKKYLCLIICILIALSSMNTSFAAENSSINDIELRNLAIAQNKVLSMDEYNIIRNKYKDDVIGLDNALKKYYVTTERDTKLTRLADDGNYIGEVAIREKYVYVHNKDTGENFNIGAVSSGKPKDYTDTFMGFLGFVPKIGVVISVISLIKSVIQIEQATTADSVGFKEQYSYKVTIKTAVYWDGNTWYIAARTEKRKVDGFYVISAYIPEHVAKTRKVGTIRIDTARYFDDEDTLKKIARAFVPGMSNINSQTYINGTHEFPLKEYK
ncbi:hypothetical protein AN1V17_27640 [Vallitalea sediminicola]